LTWAQLPEVRLIEKIQSGLKFCIAKNYQPAQGLDGELEEGI
jgi:hypothetical protein